MKKTSLHWIVMVLVFLTAGRLQSQEMLGLPFSLYSGISSTAINPALLTGTRVFIDVNIVNGDVSFANNMFYFPSGNKTLSQAIHLDASLFKDGEFKWGRSFNYYDNTIDKYFTNNIKITGPSVMLQDGRHAFALTTTFRSFHSGNHIPYEIPIIAYEEYSFPRFHGVEFNDNDYSFVSMTWSEIGLSYALDVYERYNNRLTFGITAKALLGHEGAYIEMRNANFIIENSSDIDFKNIDADIGFALPFGYGDEFTTNFKPLFKGYGLGLDFGLVFTKLKSTIAGRAENKLCAKPFRDFVYKIGFSILDIGAVTFTEDAQLHEFNNVSKHWLDFDTIHFRGIESQMEIYSMGFYGNPDKSHTANKIKIGLPASISLQFDYHLKKNIYLSSLWMQPLKLNARTLWRPAQLAFIPRYENRYFGVSLPVSLFNYREPRLGLAIRLYSLTMGTDRLGSLLGLFNFDGMDFYFSFSLNIGKGSCMSAKRGACSNKGFGNNW